MSSVNSICKNNEVFGSPINRIEKSFQKTKALIYIGRKFLNAASLLIGDLTILLISVVIAGVFRWWLYGESMINEWILLLFVIWSAGALMARLLPGWGLGAVEELRRVVILLFGVYGSVAIALFILKQSQEVSRLVILLSLIISIIFVPFSRMFVKKILVFYRVWGIPTVIYANLKTSKSIVRTLLDNKGFGYLPVGVFCYDNKTNLTEFDGVPILEKPNKSVIKAPIAILAIPERSREQIVELLDGQLSVYRQVIIIPNLFEVQSLWVKTRDLGGILGLEITRNLRDPVSSFVKLISDYCLVAFCSFFWVPICLTIALVIWLEDGANPLFFQQRIGKNGESFRAWKFRTMIPNAEEVLEEELERDKDLRVEWDKNFKLKNDPRITRVGSVLRRTSLDELPQLVNVMLGEMSLVGPRPLPEYHFEELDIAAKRLRKHVSPGMTGLWQVSGRSDTGMTTMRRLDTYYVRNWSIWLDIIILIRTIKTIIKGNGAY